MKNAVNTIARVTGIFATVIFALLLIWYLIRYFTESAGYAPLNEKRKPMQVREARAPLWEVIVWTLAAFAVSRMLMYLGGIIGAAEAGRLQAYLSAPEQFWTRWDADHYVGLIENWYVNEGDPRLHIVFFPLFPMLGRLLHLTTGISPTACGYIVSNLAFIGCGIVMFRLTEITYGKNTGLKALWFMNLSPLTLFCSLPYTESVFMLTTLLAVYFARRKKFAAAVIMGALAANSRMVGMATAIPIFYELLSSVKEKTFKSYALAVLKVLPVSLGLLAYLALNLEVTGDAFKFMEYQSGHWSQNFGSLANTLNYTIKNAYDFHAEGYIVGVWRPQTIAILAALVLFLLMLRKAHPGDMGYSLVYYYCSVAPTWLLSGPRYLTAMYAAYPFMARIFRDTGAFIAVSLVLAVLCVIAGSMFSIQGCIL